MKRKPNKRNNPFSKFYNKKPQKADYNEEEKKPPLDHNKSVNKSFKKKRFSKTDNKRLSENKENEIKQTHTATPEENMRLNKYIAHSGICSRRKASEYIKNGAVKVNDKIETEMGYKVQKNDIVKFQDKVIQPTKNHVYILLNKPKNVITTLKDENNRKTVLDFVSELTKERIYPIGRLDRNTTGLLLLTNDGRFAQKLSHPSFEVKKVYKTTLNKALSTKDLEKIRNTLHLEDGPAPVDAIEYGNSKKIVGIEIHIGRNRIVRRIFEHLGYEVKKLDRVRYSSLTKKNLPVGKCRFLSDTELIELKHLL
ncbi:MAG: rRNA pseudouridine synthase [Saprospiraceae bacterium]|nr:rRNA pseudouridine synthase [Saprospiraceae bacterium]